MKSQEVSKKFRVSRALPKADMHVHISLGYSPETFMVRVKKSRAKDLDLNFLLDKERRYFEDLTEFHGTYEKLRDTTRLNELATTVQEYLERCAAEGAIYVEVQSTFRNEKDFKPQIREIIKGIEAARENFGVEARIVVTSIRNYGADRALEIAQFLAKPENKHPYITGFGLVGDEGVDRISEYKSALHTAWDAGYSLTPHIGEQHVHNIVDYLDIIPKEAYEPTANDSRRLRAGHVTQSYLSEELMAALKDMDMCTEVCLSANKRINVPPITKSLAVDDIVFNTPETKGIKVDKEHLEYFKHIQNHPIKMFLDRGMKVCLGSDNPFLMNTNIGKEYSLAVMAGVDPIKQTLELTKNAIRYAFMDAVTRVRLLQKITEYEDKIGHGREPKHTPLGYRVPEEFNPDY